MTAPTRIYVTPNIAWPGAIDALALVKNVDYGFIAPNVEYVRDDLHRGALQEIERIETARKAAYLNAMQQEARAKAAEKERDNLQLMLNDANAENAELRQRVAGVSPVTGCRIDGKQLVCDHWQARAESAEQERDQLRERVKEFEADYQSAMDECCDGATSQDDAQHCTCVAPMRIAMRVLMQERDQLLREGEYDQRNAAMSQRESMQLLEERDQLREMVANTQDFTREECVRKIDALIAKESAKSAVSR